MYKFKIQRLLKEKLGVQYKCNIAEGKFGDTFLLQMPSGDTKAGKIVSEDRMHRGEMEVWPLLDHQNVVRLEKTILMPDLQACCFVMPRYHMTLKEIVKTDCFQSDEDSLFDMKRWLLDTLCAVEYLHQHNLCHLNILASNVLISYDSRAKLGGLRLVSPATHPVSG